LGKKIVFIVIQLQTEKYPSKSEEEGETWLTLGLERASDRLNKYIEKNDVIHPDNLKEEHLPETDDPQVEKIDLQAKDDGYLSGKWIIQVKPEDIDDIWGTLDELIKDSLVWGAQVSTKWLREKKDEDDHILKVYTPNYFDEMDVLRVRKLLKDECDIKEEIVYKPDIYNILGIYSGEGDLIELPEENRYKE